MNYLQVQAKEGSTIHGGPSADSPPGREHNSGRQTNVRSDHNHPSISPLQSSVKLEKGSEGSDWTASLAARKAVMVMRILKKPKRFFFKKMHEGKNGVANFGWNLQQHADVCLFLFLGFEKREDGGRFDVRVSARYKPQRDPNYHERKRASEQSAVTSQAQGELASAPQGYSCSAFFFFLLASSSAATAAKATLPARASASRQDDARVHGPRGGGRRAGGRRGAGPRCGGVRGGDGLRRAGEHHAGGRGAPGDRGRRGERHPCRGAHGGAHRGRPRERALGVWSGHGGGRPGPRHARAGAVPAPADAARGGRPRRRRGQQQRRALLLLRRRPRRRSLGGGAPLGREEPRARPGVVDRLPPPHRGRHTLQRRRERAVVPVRPAGVERGGAGGGDGRRRVPRLLAVLPPGPLPRGAGRAGSVRRHHARPHPSPAGSPVGAVDAGGVRELRRLHGRRGVAGDAAPRGGGGVRLRGGLRVRQQRRPRQRVAVRALPRRRPLRRLPPPRRHRTRPLLPRGRPVPVPGCRGGGRRGQGRGGGGGGREADDGAAQVRAGPGVRGGGRVRGLFVPREPGGGGGPPQRQLGRAAPVAQPLRLRPRHRRLRPRRHQGHARRRHRRAHAHLPHAQEQVGPEHVGCAAGRRGVLPGGAAAVLPCGRAGGGRAGGAERRDPPGVPRQRVRPQGLLPELPGRGGVGAPLRRRQVEALRGAQGPLRPAGDPRAGPEDLPQGPGGVRRRRVAQHSSPGGGGHGTGRGGGGPAMS